MQSLGTLAGISQLSQGGRGTCYHRRHTGPPCLLPAPPSRYAAAVFASVPEARAGWPHCDQRRRRSACPSSRSTPSSASTVYQPHIIMDPSILSMQPFSKSEHPKHLIRHLLLGSLSLVKGPPTHFSLGHSCPSHPTDMSTLKDRSP